MNHSNRRANSGETVRTVVYAVLIALVIRTVAYEPFNIPSGSMIPTLLIGDYLFVSKFSYGYSRYSLPFSLPLIPDRIFSKPPKRGDVVVFKKPPQNEIDFIKRVVGLPGDRIQVKNGLLYINGAPVVREPAGDYVIRDSDGRSTLYARFVEILPNGRRHHILEQSDKGFMDNTGVYTVPPGHYFVMGDNRDHSKDSRFQEVGFIPLRNMVGRAEFMFFSIDGNAWKIWEWLSTVRFKRIFSSIE